MTGTERHMYPGNNTPEGFFSYYQYILGQREADKIICIKGGPGVGKSTFMRKIGEAMLEEGHDVDFMHCSSDNGSLDGIVLRDKKIALIDGTSPHVVLSILLNNLSGLYLFIEIHFTRIIPPIDIEPIICIIKGQRPCLYSISSQPMGGNIIVCSINCRR